MKKLILAACALTCAASVFAQGTVVFNNRVTGTTVSKVYAPFATDTARVQSGNSATDFPAGTTDWTGWTALAGATYSAQLYAAPGTVTDAGSLVAASSAATTFRTGAAAGFVNPVTATLTGVAADAASATLQLRVWDNTTGATWEAAATKGASALFVVNAIGGSLNPAPNLVGLTSFNITSTVPEPSTFALVGLGTAALLIFRRRK